MASFGMQLAALEDLKRRHRLLYGDTAPDLPVQQPGEEQPQQGSQPAQVAKQLPGTAVQQEAAISQPAPAAAPAAAAPAAPAAAAPQPQPDQTPMQFYAPSTFSPSKAAASRAILGGK